MIFPAINQCMSGHPGLEFAIAQEAIITMTHPHQNNAYRILSTIVSASFSSKLGTKAVPQRCGDVL
jgi:hypothetical protein